MLKGERIGYEKEMEYCFTDENGMLLMISWGAGVIQDV